MTKRNKKYQKEQIDSVISETYLYNYMNKFGVFLFWTLLFVFVIEVLVIITTYVGYFPIHLNIQSEYRDPSYIAFVKNIVIVNLSSWIVYITYSIIYKYISYKNKKISVCISFMLITTIYTFGLYRFSYLSFFYVLPIIVSIPLGKGCRRGVFISSLFLSFIYSIYQQKLFNENLDYLVNSVTLITLVASYLLTTNVYRIFAKSLIDVEDYASQVEKLNDNIMHDYNTGAFSKYALYKDLRHNTNYLSIAFVDLDDFKSINDNMGHNIGDTILKLLVNTITEKGEVIYRYGGDEFIVLSKLSVDELAAKLDCTKNVFKQSALETVNCDISFSAGVAEINLDKTIAELINECDEMMYISKHDGKNKVTMKS